MTKVLVVGAGPVGLTMAAELARHGVRCQLIDSRDKPLPFCRAIGATPRTLEIWEDMGIVRHMIDAGLWLTGMRSIVQGFPVKDAPLDYSDLPYSNLGIPQYETERILTQHCAQFGIFVERGVRLVSLSNGESKVVAEIESPAKTIEQRMFDYVVGCDGAHSTVRKQIGISFDGEAYPRMFMLGDIYLDYDLPRGVALRAVRLKENDAPDMFIAIPLPEPGRYRVSMLAPDDFPSTGGTTHGIQSESPGPTLEHLQAVADDLIPEKPRLSDLRWSSTFRISMRLAGSYRVGRCFIAGDAAHIHPPTGGQGMNTGIQDAYNLAWKLALVLKKMSPPALLDSYDAERRPVGKDVLERTIAASVNFGREKTAAPPHRLADTQLLVNYRTSGWVRDDAGNDDETFPHAGDRAPDCTGLQRLGVGFPLRMFEVLRGTDHLLVVHLARTNLSAETIRLSDFAASMHATLGESLRVAAIVPPVEISIDLPRISVLRDVDGQFAAAYGNVARAFLIRPDGYIGWRGRSWTEPGLTEHLQRLFAV